MAELFTLPKQVPIQSSGAPWAGAKAYFYRAGTTTDQSVYTDAACSVAHAQPVVADANGVFAPIYKNPAASYDYRLQLKQSDGTLIYDVDNIPRFALTQAQIGALFYPRTAAEIAAGVTPTYYYYESGDVRRYGAVGNGSTDDTVPLQNAALVVTTAGTGSIIFEHGKNYKVWVGSSPDLMYISNATGVVIEGNGATITSGRTNGPNVYAIRFSGCSMCEVNNLKFVGSNTTITSDTGEGFLSLISATTDVHVKNCSAYNCQNGIRCGDGSNPGTSRTKRVAIDNFYCYLAYYPLACSNDGDDVVARNFVTYGAGRSYFPWNVKNHDIHLSSSHGGPFSDCLLKVYVDTTWQYYALENIKLKYHSEGRASIGIAQIADEAMIAFDVAQVNAVDTGAANINNIDIEFDVDATASPNTRRLLIMRRYLHTGAVDTTVRNHIFVNWKISGKVASGQNFTEDIITLFSSLGTWTGDFAAAFLLENIFIAGSATQNGIVINGAPFASAQSGLMLHNVTTDTDISISGMNSAAPLSLINVVADNYRQYVTATYDPPNLADGAGTTTTVAVSGAQLGDAVACSFSADLQGITMTAWVSAADTVSIRFQNESGGAIDLASGTIRVWVNPRTV